MYCVSCKFKKREKNLQKIKTEKSKLENLEVSVSRDFLDYDSLKIGICYVLSTVQPTAEAKLFNFFYTNF